ncbi:aspartyl/asparaginyl beta-hydroxylase domain-containing protein [Actinokineospora guangxiensis]|uniref:Aspartyl/asparaginyl beta-hydroxylase domain-containing protein n=1 Tax=Actinokineospora guangxiensis TaxID=1490288 RepID=A0ABW0EP15_9PSEU
MFDIDRICPALRAVDAAFEDIREEARAVLADRESVPVYHDVDPEQHCISAVTPHDWRVYYLWIMGLRAEPNATRCPRTTAALERVPGLFQAHFSVLDPGKSIPAHRGPYAGYLRYHLAVEVPSADPPHLRIADHVHTWKEGESVLFDDSHEHEVVNTAAERRVVLIVDVARPMPVTQRIAHRVATRIAREVYGKSVLRRAEERAATLGPAGP